jgi:hypothetical protein
MSKSGLYVLIAVLIVAVGGFAAYTYREETKPGVELKADENGVSLEAN